MAPWTMTADHAPRHLTPGAVNSLALLPAFILAAFTPALKKLAVKAAGRELTPDRDHHYIDRRGISGASFVNATDDADFTRNFNAGQDFPVVIIGIRNDRRVDFPDINTIRVAPQPVSKP